MKEKLFAIWKEIYPYLIVIGVALIIRTFIASPVRVKGTSMINTLKDGEILVLNKMSKNYDRFDIVVIDVGNTKIIKRIIGLPGESIDYRNNTLYINNKEIKDAKGVVGPTKDFSLEQLTNYEVLPDNYYFVMGDNRNGSSDSRVKEIGLIKKNQILGKASLRIWPLNKIGFAK